MPCLMVLFALFVPRVVIVLLWLFTHWFSGIFNVALWPVLGFVFLVLGPVVVILWLALVRMTLEFYFAIVRMSQDINRRLPGR